MANHPNRSKYAIRVTPHYYAGDIWGRDRTHLLRGYHSDGQLIVLGSREDAEAIARMQTDHGPAYQLANNQYAAPEYEVVRYKGVALALSLPQAMAETGNQYDFRPDGSRIELTDSAMNKAHTKVHKPNLGPYTDDNPKYCLDCGKLGHYWSEINEPCEPHPEGSPLLPVEE